MKHIDNTITYPLEDVMALAVMAQRINDDYLPRDNVMKDDEGKIISCRLANKDLIKHGLGVLKPGTSNIMQFYTDNVADDDDLAVARDIISYYTGLMFKAIGGKINDFEERVLDIVKKGVVQVYDFGVIASLPKSYDRNVAREAVEQKQRELSHNSMHIGLVGDTVDMGLEIMRVNFIQKLNCYVVNAQYDENLVVFFTGNADFKNGPTDVKVRGRVKRHQVSNYHGGKETVFNYVKVV